MNIAGLRVRVTIQKNETVTDQYRNHKSVWLDLTVRYSSETAAVNSKQYRILLGGRIYNILSIDEMGFKHNSRKLHTKLAER